MKRLLWLILPLLNACASSPPQVSPSPNLPPLESLGPSTPQIDYDSLKRSLGLDRDKDSLGLEEKKFNTCEVGFGYPSNMNCHSEYFVVLNFQLLCRDSTGTISNVLTSVDLRPLERRTVRWSAKGIKGHLQTDSDGYGQIIATSTSSQKAQRVRLGIGNEFLYMRSGDIKKIITPQNWCEQY